MGRMITKTRPTALIKAKRSSSRISVMALRRRCYWVSRNYPLQFYSQVTNLAQAQPLKLWNVLGHLFEHVFNQINAVCSRQLLDEVPQYFPIFPSIARGLNGAV